jgi:hypothetical protein
MAASRKTAVATTSVSAPPTATSAASKKTPSPIQLRTGTYAAWSATANSAPAATGGQRRLRARSTTTAAGTSSGRAGGGKSTSARNPATSPMNRVYTTAAEVAAHRASVAARTSSSPRTAAQAEHGQVERLVELRDVGVVLDRREAGRGEDQRPGDDGQRPRPPLGPTGQLGEDRRSQSQGAGDAEHVRRAPDDRVAPERGMPSVVDRPGRQRRGDAHEREDQRAVPPHRRDAVLARSKKCPTAESSARDGDPGVDRDVRRDEELVAAAFGVPGVVPVAAGKR